MVAYLLITILRRRVTSLCMRHCALGNCVQRAKSGSAHLVVELGFLRVTRVLRGDSKNEIEAQQEQREEYPHRVLDRQWRGLAGEQMVRSRVYVGSRRLAWRTDVSLFLLATFPDLSPQLACS